MSPRLSFCLFIRSSRQILLPRYLMNGLSNLDETYGECSLAPTDNLVRFWRSKVKVTTVRGEGFHFDTGASKSNFCLTVALNVVSVELMRVWWWCCNSEMMLDLFTGFDQYLVGILTQLSRNKSIKRLAIGKNMSGNRPRWTAAVYYWLVCKLSCTFSDLTRFFGS